MALIERDFPIEQLNDIADKEGNAKKPIYQMHKWWARRLGSIFRAIILSALLPDDSKGLFEEAAEFGGDKPLFYRRHELGKVILDPFMGGGTTIVEGLRLGCKVIGLDINPVAWFVTKKEIEPVDLKELDAAFKEVEAAVADRIRSFYQYVRHIMAGRKGRQCDECCPTAPHGEKSLQLNSRPVFAEAFLLSRSHSGSRDSRLSSPTR